MFFLTTHVLIGKYYPKLLTQFIIGCTCYIITFFVFNEVSPDDFFDNAKYYILTFIILDASFMIYKIKSLRDAQRQRQFRSFDPYTKNNKLNDPQNSNITLTSEIHDIKITHEQSQHDIENQMFSTSDEKPDVLLTKNLNLATSSEPIFLSSRIMAPIKNELSNTDSNNASELSVNLSD